MEGSEGSEGQSQIGGERREWNREREPRGTKLGREGCTWLFVQGPRVPRYATADGAGLPILTPWLA